MPASSQAYTNQVLKVVVARICQTVGFNSVQSTPMDVMIDVLHNYIRELCVLTKDYAEHCKGLSTFISSFSFICPSLQTIVRNPIWMMSLWLTVK